MRNSNPGVRLFDMRTLDLADITRLAAELQSGETIELVSEGRTVARVEPVREMTDEERIEDLLARGVISKRPQPLPDWFFTAPRPKPKSGSVLQQLLDDRKSRDW